MKEKLEKTLSDFASLTKSDICAEIGRHFRDLYCSVMPTSNLKTDRADPSLPRMLPHRVLVQLCAASCYQ